MNEPPDQDFRKPYVDIGQWHDTPVRHRYGHGGFADNDARFSLYFLPVEAYQGRFFQYLTPVLAASTGHRPPAGRRTGSPSPHRAARTSWKPTAAARTRAT
ncbi:hypothetical protein [Streptomyces shenzhenensis]|uniref:hypothetical protein n=1 Tax=Streptomyces shenzhenensis TaxID=943815 RepID=UPI001C6899DF|nr:hypothetical protein [Streptomyces shenzhenensis]